MVIVHGPGEVAYVTKLDDGSWLIETSPDVRLETRAETPAEACARLYREAEERSQGVTGHV